MMKKLPEIIRYALTLMFIIIFSEYIVMLTLHTTGLDQRLPEEINAILDALLMAMLSAAPICFFIIKPMVKTSTAYTDKLKNLVAALDGAGESVMITESDGTIIYVNKTFANVTGYAFDEIVGNNPRILQSGKQSKAFYKMMWRSILQTGEWKGELWNKRKDGAIYPGRLHIKSILGDDESVKFYICNFTDITEQHEQEKLLRQAQKMDAIGNLVAGVAHNFNNVLAAILGNTYLAKKNTAHNPKVIGYLESVEKSSQEAALMVKQLLNFSHASAQQKKPVDAVQLVEEAMETAKLGISEDIELITSLTSDSLIVFCDPVDIQQVIINLLNNARDALEGCEKKTLKVSVEKKMRDDCLHSLSCHGCTRETMCLVIEDTGSGIKDTDIAHIFDPFFTTKTLGEGTGLGLSMAKGTVESHGGSFHVCSEYGIGSRFEICLPLSSVTLKEQQEQRKIVRSKNQETILIIDDEEMVRITLEELLFSLGYCVLTANDGEEGVQVFLENADDIALVVSDVVMPKLDGLAAVAKMRSVKADQPVLFMTGYSEKEIEAGERTIVTSKPFRIEDLSHQIAALIYPKNK